MDPLSTMALVASFLVAPISTARPEWERLRARGGTSLAREQTDTPLLAEPGSTESILFDPGSAVYGDARDVIKLEIDDYSRLPAGWDGEQSIPPVKSTVVSAMRLVDAFPSAFPLPTPMLSADGEIGFYWDLDGGYADISVDRDGAVSVFLRTRGNKEHFEDTLNVEHLSAKWFYDTMGEIVAPVARAA